MPNRILRDYTDSLRFDGISAEGERLFIRLLTKADDYGRFHADPRLVCAACFPLEQSIEPKHAAKWLAELEQRGLIVTYHAEGKHCLAIINYGQRLRNSRVKFPPPADKDREWLPTSSDSPQLAATSRDFPPESQSQTESQTETKTLGRNFAVAVATASVKKSELSDEEWLKELVSNPAYDGINVPIEFARMQTWCSANRKQATRRRFVNWLNRVDKPLNRAVVPLNSHTKPQEGVWHLEKRIEAAQKEIERIQSNPSNKEQIPDSFDRRLKPEHMAKVKALKASISEMRQRMAGVEVAA